MQLHAHDKELFPFLVRSPSIVSWFLSFYEHRSARNNERSYVTTFAESEGRILSHCCVRCIRRPTESRQDQEEGGELDSHDELDCHLRVQARPRGGRWCWTLKRAQERSKVRTHSRKHARARARAHTHIHTHAISQPLAPLSFS